MRVMSALLRFRLGRASEAADLCKRVRLGDNDTTDTRALHAVTAHVAAIGGHTHTHTHTYPFIRVDWCMPVAVALYLTARL